MRPPRLARASLCASLLAAAAWAQDPPKPEPPKVEPAKQDEPKQDEPKKEEPKKEEPAPRTAGFTGSLDDVASKFSSCRVREIGRSAGDRPLRVATVLGGGTADEKDVLWVALVVAGLDGEKAREDTVLATDLAAWLAERAQSLPPRTAVRVLADANPDATAARPRNDTATDDDQDGETGEDPPDDLDGDGVLSWMRIPDLAGQFAADDAAKPGEPQRAEPAKGRTAAWRVVREGLDDDGDGVFNEDGAGGVDVGRNFTVGFEEHVPAAGRWPASEKETRALLDHLLADERVAVVYEIGALENVAANADGQWTKLPDDDMKLLEGLRSGHAKGPVAERKPRAPGGGSLAAATIHQLGRIWFGRAPLGRTGAPWPADDATWPANLRITWTKAPAFGLPAGTEIGVPAPPPAGAKPAPSVFAETESIADFLVALAKGRAEISFADVVKSGEPGVLRLAARVVNAGRLPTHTQRGADVKGRRPLNVRVVLPQGAALAAGNPLVQIERLAGGARSEEMRWVVRGPAGAAVRVECVSPDAGTAVLEAKIP